MHEPTMRQPSDVGQWLLLLRDGTESEQQLARTELGLLLEARGMLDDAAEAYTRNVADGVTDRRPYERLAALARQRGDVEGEAATLRALADLLAPPPLPPPPPAPPAPDPEPELTLAPELSPDLSLAAAAGADLVAPVDAPEMVEDEAPVDLELAMAAGADLTAPLAPGISVVPDAVTPPAEASPETQNPKPETQRRNLTPQPQANLTPQPPLRRGEGETRDSSVIPPVDAPVAEDDSAVGADAEGADAEPAVGGPVESAPAEVEPAVPDVDADEQRLDAEAATDAHADEQPAEADEQPADAAPASDVAASRDAREDAATTASAHTDAAEDVDAEVLPVAASPRSAPERGAGGVRSPAEADGVRSPATEPAPQASGVSRWVLTLCGLVVAAVVVGAALMVPVSRPLNVTPGQPATSPAPLEIQLSATAPALRASPAPEASPSPLAVALTPTAAASPTSGPPPLAARCADAALRFPESADTQGAVRAAFRDYLARQGVTIDPASTLFAGLSDAYAERHAEVVAGWMAVTLQRERRGLPTFSLVDYVSSDVIAPSGPAEYQLRATVSPQGWTELRNTPAETCEGAFFANPANARWIELMQASVGDITWALPTPQPRP